MNRGTRDRRSATRGQLVLVGVLAAVLVCVLAANFRGSAEELAVVAPSGAAAPVELSASQASAAASPFGDFAVDGDWPVAALDEVTSFDPLAAPEWMAIGEQETAAGAETNAQSLEEIQQAQNAIIFVTGDERVARIGTQEYRIGDAIGRFRITDISSAGIVLSDPQGNAHAQ